MSKNAWLVATGFSLIAVCYGFARFAFGLFLPRIDADLSLSPTLSGLISGGSFLGYCLTIVLAAVLTERIGPRAVALTAALVAALGMTGIALASSPLWLAAAVMLAGASTGLVSPPLAAAVSAVIPAERQGAANTIINAGTGAGVVLSGPVALAMGGQWRLAFALFAALAFAMAIAAARFVPRSSPATSNRAGGLPPISASLKRLIVASLLMGAGSTAIWSFGSQLVALRLEWRDTGAGVLWMVTGAAGIAGAAAGTLVARFGMDLMHRLFLLAMAAGMLLIGFESTTPALTLIGGALFGAAYITISGIYLVWGVSALPERPATGLMICFLTLAVGQTAGSPLFGLIMDRLSAGYAVAIFAGLTICAGSSGTVPLHSAWRKRFRKA